MKLEKKMFGLIGIVFLLFSVTSVVAIQHIGPEWQIHQDSTSWWDRFVRSLFGTQMRMVGGGLCSTYPDASGWCQQSPSCYVTCPSDTTGCVLQSYEHNGGLVLDITLSPGVGGYVANGRDWEIYYCKAGNCICGTERDGGCGQGGCAANEMLRLRDCSPDTCSWESICVWRQ